MDSLNKVILVTVIVSIVIASSLIYLAITNANTILMHTKHVSLKSITTLTVPSNSVAIVNIKKGAVQVKNIDTNMTFTKVDDTSFVLSPGHYSVKALGDVNIYIVKDVTSLRSKAGLVTYMFIYLLAAAIITGFVLGIVAERMVGNMLLAVCMAVALTVFMGCAVIASFLMPSMAVTVAHALVSS